MALGLLLVLALVVFPACEGEGPSTTEIPYDHPGIFVEETIGNIDSLDPAWAYDTASGEQLTYAYETLIAYDGESTSELVPVLATALPSISGTDVTFTIQTGVKFYLGGNLTAEDVEYSIERALVQDRAGGPVWMLYMTLLGVDGSRGGGGSFQVTGQQIDDAVDVSGNQVTFHVDSEPMVPLFLQMMTGTWASILDKGWCIDNGDWDPAVYQLSDEAPLTGWKHYNNPAKSASYLYNHMNGTGPWQLTSPSDYTNGVSITLHANGTWWQGTPPFTSVVVKWIDEFSTRKTDFTTGLADHIYVPRQYIHQLDDYEVQVHYPLPGLQCDAFFFNFNIPANTWIGSGALDGNGIPPDFFTDLNVRKAFSQLFDYDTYITTALLGEGIRLGSPVVEGLPYYDEDASMYDFDLTAANASMNAAWGGVLASTGFKFTVSYNTGNIARQTACTILTQNVNKLSNNYLVNAQPRLWSTILNDIVAGSMPMFQIGWLADYPDPDNFVVPFMASWGTFSEFQSYSNPAVDALILQGEGTANAAIRANVYDQLQQLYYTDAPGIMLAQPSGRAYFTPYIHGYYFNPMIPGTPGPLWQMSKSTTKEL